MSEPKHNFTQAEAAALMGRFVRDAGDGSLGKIVAVSASEDESDGVEKLLGQFLVHDTHGVVKHEHDIRYQDLLMGEFELLEGIGHQVAKMNWQAEARGAVTIKEHSERREQDYSQQTAAFEKRFARITTTETFREDVEIVRDTDPRVGNDLEEAVVIEDGLRCRIYTGTDTYLLAGHEGDREFSREEARALVGQMVDCRIDGFGKVMGYIEVQRPDQAWVYGVDVQWSKHSQMEGKETATYFTSFVTDGVRLLDGVAAEEAGRAWDRQQVMTSAEFAKDEQRRAAMKAESLLSIVASLAEREAQKSETKQLDQDQGLGA